MTHGLTVIRSTKPRAKGNNRKWCRCVCGWEGTVRIAQIAKRTAKCQRDRARL